MYTNDQTRDAVHDSADAQTATDGPTGLDASGVAVDALSGAASDRSMPNGIVLEALTDRAIVRIEVDGEIASNARPGGSDPVSDDGVVIARFDAVGRRDSFRFSGTMVDLEVAVGDVEVALDLHGDDPTHRERPTRLSVHAQGSEVDYEFAASGDVESGSGTESAAEDDDAVTGTVSGSGVDEYVFTGEITAFETSTDAVLVLVNDRIVDPADLG